MLTLVIVVDLGQAADELGQSAACPSGTAMAASVLQPAGCGSITAPTRETAFSLQPREEGEHGGLVHAQALRNHRERARHEREVALELVEQAGLGRGQQVVAMFMTRSGWRAR